MNPKDIVDLYWVAEDAYTVTSFPDGTLELRFPIEPIPYEYYHVRWTSTPIKPAKKGFEFL